MKVNQPAQMTLATALPDLQTLANELEKLSLYVGPGGVVDERALREMSFASKQDDVFELTSAVANRDTRRALVQLAGYSTAAQPPRAYFLCSPGRCAR